MGILIDKEVTRGPPLDEAVRVRSNSSSSSTPVGDISLGWLAFCYPRAVGFDGFMD